MSKNISLKELQEIELNILESFHEFCEEHKLKYYLIGGTLLGAIRHKGFIPWDDDIDVCMPRKDYELFFKLFLETNRKSYLKIATYKYMKNFSLAFTKLYDNRLLLQEGYLKNPYNLGPWIDIFPLDNMPNNYYKACFFFYKVRFWKYLASCKIRVKGNNKFRTAFRSFINFLLLPISNYKLQKKLDELSQHYESEVFNKYVCIVILGTYGTKEIMESNLFSKRELHPFENKNFYIPCGYHQILTNFYGDYNKLPPIEKRKPHHDIITVQEKNI